MKRERGYVALAMLVVIASLSAVWITHALVQAKQNSTLRAQRDTLRALKDAKLALIAHALMEDNTPGSLPCPTDDLDGSLDNPSANCGTATQPTVGRFPFYRLGMMPLQDEAGECLWYAVSGAHKNTGSVAERGGSTRAALNPAYTGGLTLAGTSNNTTVAALLIAPGSPLNEQIGKRGTASGIACRSGNIDAFLDQASEQSNADGDSIYLSQPNSISFNDQVLAITHQDLMRPVLRRVLLELSGAPVRAEIGTRLANGTSGSLSDIRLDRNHCPGTVPTCAANFDKLLYASAPAPTTRSCPYDGATALLPVSWLCLNQWYEQIALQSSPQGQFMQLALLPGSGGSYRCRTDLATGEVQCGTQF